MKLAFNGQAKYPDYNDGYEKYRNRKRFDKPVPLNVYKNVVRDYCKIIAEELENNGMAELPAGLGMIAAATFTRKPYYRDNKFVGFGKMDWKNGNYDGSFKAFGITFLPKHDKKNMRCFGFVANRQLFKRMKNIYDSENCNWTPLDFNDKMV